MLGYSGPSRTHEAWQNWHMMNVLINKTVEVAGYPCASGISSPMRTEMFAQSDEEKHDPSHLGP